MDAIERELRGHVRAARGVRGLHYRSLSGPERFWSDAASLAMVTALDRVGECQAVAVEAMDRFGLGIAVGWCLDLDGRPCWHCCNTSRAAQIVDAGRDRHRPGMVGKVLTEDEAAMLARAAGQRSTTEMGEAGRSLGRAFSALLG